MQDLLPLPITVSHERLRSDITLGIKSMGFSAQQLLIENLAKSVSSLRWGLGLSVYNTDLGSQIQLLGH